MPFSDRERVIMTIEKFSFGVGDRFAHQAAAQLRAFQLLGEQGIQVAPVWNKSHREHMTIGSEPASVRAAADAAVSELGWEGAYYVDADHIRLETVDGFLDSSNFFTLDVADSIGQPAAEADVESFIARHPELVGTLQVRGIDAPFEISREEVARVARKYLLAVQQAGKIYRHIEAAKGADNFVTEVSSDETDSPQTPPELLIILAALS
ncbi:MAG TPA: tagaturonate epimerase family protein, partial [Abditibacteriaceae bacterium]